MSTAGLWIHVIAHALIAVAYGAILISLLYFLARRRDLRLHWVFLCVGGFVLALGTTRALEVWRAWSPGSGPVEIIEVFAGLVAVPTAIMIARLIGVDMQYCDRIFDMFQRLHQRDKFDGSGIGLSIAKRIVERHGGRIWLESAPGAGATFHVTLHPSREAAA